MPTCRRRRRSQATAARHASAPRPSSQQYLSSHSRVAASSYPARTRRRESRSRAALQTSFARCDTCPSAPQHNSRHAARIIRARQAVQRAVRGCVRVCGFVKIEAGAGLRSGYAVVTQAARRRRPCVSQVEVISTGSAQRCRVSDSWSPTSRVKCSRRISTCEALTPAARLPESRHARPVQRYGQWPPTASAILPRADHLPALPPHRVCVYGSFFRRVSCLCIIFVCQVKI